MSYNIHLAINIGSERMLYEGEMFIDDKKYDELIKLGYEAAKKNVRQFESKYSCTFGNMDPRVERKLNPEEYDQWRISCMALDVIEKRLH
jgi:hypothetical protein